MRKPFVSRNIVADMTNFDWEIYLLNYPELVQKGINTKSAACHHYKTIGFWEQRSCSISDKFDSEKYLKTYSYLGLKTPRDAYIHFMKVGTLMKKNDGMHRQTEAYRMPAMRSSVKRHFGNKIFMKQEKPAVVEDVVTKTIKRPSNIVIPSLVSMHTNTKRNIKQPKPGQLVLLHEPPSSYFRRMCIVHPPKIFTRKT